MQFPFNDRPFVLNVLYGLFVVLPVFFFFPLHESFVAVAAVIGIGFMMQLIMLVNGADKPEGSVRYNRETGEWDYTKD